MLWYALVWLSLGLHRSLIIEKSVYGKDGMRVQKNHGWMINFCGE